MAFSANTIMPVVSAGRASGMHVEVHSAAGTEEGFGEPVVDEACRSVEQHRVRVGSDLETRKTLRACDRNGIRDQAEGHAAPHPTRIDEEVVEFDGMSVRVGACVGACGGETDDACAFRGDPGAAFGDRGVVELERVGMSEKIRPITVVGQRRPAKDVANRAHIVGLGGANQVLVHVHSLTVLEHPEK